MNLTTHTSYIPLIAITFLAIGALLLLASFTVGMKINDYHRALGIWLCSAPPLIIGVVVMSFAPGSAALKTSTFPVTHYVTKHQERSALASLYHVTYAGHDDSGDTYRRSNGSMLYGCATHYTKHTTSVHLDALTCGQNVVR